MGHLQYICKGPEKQRLQFDASDPPRVRAIQGHSLSCLDDDLMHTRLDMGMDIPEWVKHMTESQYVRSIMRKGLRAGGAGPGKDYRLHVHMVTIDKQPGDAVAGLRAQATEAIYVRLQLAMEQGIVFHRTITGVYLTRSTIPRDLLSRSMD